MKTTVPAPPTTATLPPAPGAAVTPALAVAGPPHDRIGGPLRHPGSPIYALPFYVVDGRPDPQLAAVTDSAYANRASMFATLKALGYNTVRIPLQASVVAADPYGLGGMRGYLDRLQAFVDAATGAGLYVDVSWWDAFNEGASLPGDYTAEFPMMKAVVDRFSDDPRVIYEPFNEPNGISWDQWIVTFERVLLYWRGSLGYRGVIIADTPNWSRDFDPTYAAALIRYDRALLGSPNLMIANPRYPNGNQCSAGPTAACGCRRWVSTPTGTRSSERSTASPTATGHRRCHGDRASSPTSQTCRSRRASTGDHLRVELDRRQLHDLTARRGHDHLGRVGYVRVGRTVTPADAPTAPPRPIRSAT